MTASSSSGDLGSARARLLAAAAGRLAPRPWQAPGQPASDADLVRLAAWKAADPTCDDLEVLEAGLRLLSSAREEVDQCEAALLFAARAAGMTWPRLADALGLGSAQAAQQRSTRVSARSAGSP